MPQLLFYLNVDKQTTLKLSEAANANLNQEKKEMIFENMFNEVIINCLSFSYLYNLSYCIN